MPNLNEISELNETLKEIRSSNAEFPIIFTKFLLDNLNLTNKIIQNNVDLEEGFELKTLYWKDIRSNQDLRNINLNISTLEKLKIILK